MKQIELVKIVSFEKLVGTLKLDKLSGAEKYDLMKIFRKIKLVNTEFEEFKQDIITKYISTDEFKNASEKSNEGDEEAKAYIKKINDEANEILFKELASTKDIDFEGLDEELFKKFIDSNPDLSVSDLFLLEEVLL